MAARGAGAATKGFGCVAKGPKNRMVSETSKTTGPVMMAMGGDVSPRKQMAMGMMGGGMAKGYKKGGMAKKKKKVRKMREGGSCG
ncbi:MAG: hypothetical protein RI942_1924 [Pseudomonadota bacterium]